MGGVVGGPIDEGRRKEVCLTQLIVAYCSTCRYGIAHPSRERTMLLVHAGRLSLLLVLLAFALVDGGVDQEGRHHLHHDLCQVRAQFVRLEFGVVLATLCQSSQLST